MSHTKPHSEKGKKNISKAKKGKPNWKIRRETKQVDGVMLYHCSKCKDFKPRSEFYAVKSTIIGIEHNCKPCQTENRRMYHRLRAQKFQSHEKPE